MTDIDVIIEPEAEPDERPARLNGRRIVRWVTILTLGILAVLVIWQEPLYS